LALIFFRDIFFYASCKHVGLVVHVCIKSKFDHLVGMYISKFTNRYLLGWGPSKNL